jgi:hypothetical protein
MTTFTHTPGPWVYTLDARGVCGIHGGDNAKPAVRIAEVTAETQKQADANARLIAAAPDIVAEAWELLRNARYADGYAVVLTQDCEALEAAIFQATGVAVLDEQP